FDIRLEEHAFFQRDLQLAVSPEVPVASDVRAMIADMDLAAANAPAGTNTLVVSGGDTVAVSGTNTAVFSSDGPAPRRTLWQRIFGN
ncbi:hypothetical protein HKCCE4037_15815, partial [Rhodobacterales bacterium HKCCE4037]|nr:hypothetical protein [Rhodobacterales bacterium HKCCE4037]